MHTFWDPEHWQFHPQPPSPSIFLLGCTHRTLKLAPHREKEMHATEIPQQRETEAQATSAAAYCPPPPILPSLPPPRFRPKDPQGVKGSSTSCSPPLSIVPVHPRLFTSLTPPTRIIIPAPPPDRSPPLPSSAPLPFRPLGPPRLRARREVVAALVRVALQEHPPEEHRDLGRLVRWRRWILGELELTQLERQRMQQTRPLVADAPPCLRVFRTQPRCMLRRVAPARRSVLRGRLIGCLPVGAAASVVAASAVAAPIGEGGRMELKKGR
jgi:hypothetical protein